MPDYTVGVRLTAHDETGPGTASAEQNLKEVDEAAKEANEQIEGMGPAASKGAGEAARHLSGLKNALGDIVKMGAGFAFGGLIQAAGGSLVGALQGSIDKAKEFNGAVKSVQMVTGGTAEEISSTVAAFERFGVGPDRAAASISLFSRQVQKVPIDLQELASGIDESTGKPLKGFADTMHDLGITTEDATGKTRPMLDVFMDTADKFKAMGQGGDSAGKAITLFGRAGRDMLPLLMQGSEGIKAAAAEAAKLGLQLTTQNMAQIKAFSAANKDLNDAMGGLKLQIGIALMPILTALAQVGSGLAKMFNENLLPVIRVVGEWIGSMVKTVQDAWAAFLKWLEPLRGVVDVLKDLVTNVIDATGGVEGLKTIAAGAGISFGTMAAGATAFTLASTAVADAVGFMSSAFDVFTAIIAANPIMTVVLVLGVLATALYTAYQNVKWFQDIVNALGTALTSDAGAMGVVYDVLKETFGEGVADFLNPFLNGFMEAIKTVGSFVAVIGDFGRAIGTAFTSDAGALGVVYDLIRKVFGDEAAEAMQPFLENLRLFIPRLAEFATFLKEKVGAAFTWLTQTALPVFLGALGHVAGFITHEMLVTLRNLWEWLYTKMEQAVRWWQGTAWPILEGVFNSVRGFLEGPLSSAFETLHKWLFIKMMDAINWWVGTAWPALQGVWDAVGAFIDGPLATSLGDLWNWLKGKGEDAVNWWIGEGWPGLQKAWEALSSFYGTEVQPVLIDLWIWLKQKGEDALNWWQTHGPEFGAAIGKAFADLGKTVGPDETGKDVLQPLKDALKDLGSPETSEAWERFKKRMIFSPAELDSLRQLGNSLLWVADGVEKIGLALGKWAIDAQINRILGPLNTLGRLWKTVFGENPVTGPFNATAKVIDILGDAFEKLKGRLFGSIDTFNTVVGLLDRIVRALQAMSQQDWGAAMQILQGAATITPTINSGQITDLTVRPAPSEVGGPFTPGGPFGPQAGDVVMRQHGGWLTEPVIGVGPSGTRYMLHANEYVSPAGGLSEDAAAANSSLGNSPYDVIPRGVDALADYIAARRAAGDISLNVGPGAVVINGTTSAVADIAAAADGLWDDLYAKLSRALGNRAVGMGAEV